MKPTHIVGILLLTISVDVSSQTLNQTIRGQVVDSETQLPLVGATVALNTNPIIGAITDEDGRFILDNVAIGRYNIQFSYVGYEPNFVPELMITSAKEVVLYIALIESPINISEVVIKPSIRKYRPQNSMALISARSFTVEETRRYAGGFDDPARMASAFAGVSSGNLEDNAIVIRGNSPKGLLWRVEGVDVANPNHFPNGNIVGGGFVTIFSSQLLTNSDFYSGAFPSEFGNALAGVFDMKLRKGNDEKREYTFQIGTLGTEFAAEGPFIKSKPASYLINYRYSTLALLFPLLGVEQNPTYQDLSFNCNFPTKKAGILSLWGIGGIDRNTESEEKDSSQWVYNWDRIHYEMGFKLGACGINHKYNLGEKTFINSTLAATVDYSYYDQEFLDFQLQYQPDQYIEHTKGKYTFSSSLIHKFSASHTNKSGIIINRVFYNMKYEAAEDMIPGTYQLYVDDKNSDFLFQAYTQSKLNVNSQLILNLGIHSMYFELNQKYSIEPRVGIRWNFFPSHSISLGYGNHAQTEPLWIYKGEMATQNETILPNKDLDFSKSHHFILGYDLRLNERVRLKIEPYYQYLYNVPIIKDSSFSTLNFTNEFFFNEPLVNEGTGKNYGIEITLERFLHNNYYFLVTASLFDSKYTGGDGIERNTKFNRNYVFNALYGKEFFLGNGKNNVFGINARLILKGGYWDMPVDEDKSYQYRYIFYDESKPYSVRTPMEYFADLTLTYRKNKKSHSSIWAFQLKNLLFSKIYYGHDYNLKTNLIEDDLRCIVVPSISWKIEFL